MTSRLFVTALVFSLFLGASSLCLAQTRQTTLYSAENDAEIGIDRETREILINHNPVKAQIGRQHHRGHNYGAYIAIRLPAFLGEGEPVEIVEAAFAMNREYGTGGWDKGAPGFTADLWAYPARENPVAQPGDYFDTEFFTDPPAGAVFIKETFVDGGKRSSNREFVSTAANAALVDFLNQQLAAGAAGQWIVFFLAPENTEADRQTSFQGFFIMDLSGDENLDADPRLSLTFTGGGAADLEPPAAPANVTGELNDDTLELHWSPSAEDDVVGYHVIRVVDKLVTGTREFLTSTPLATTSYVDAGLPDQRWHFYWIVAVDAAGNLSPRSERLEVLTRRSAQLGADFSPDVYVQTYYVDPTHPSASDAHPGDAADQPLQTFEAAASRAITSLQAGTPTRISLAAGVHRVSNYTDLINIRDENLFVTPLLIEGASRETTRVRGSITEGFTPADWEPVPGEPGLYRASWDFNYAFYNITSYYAHNEMIQRRREMLILNDERMRQVLLEDWDWNETNRTAELIAVHDPATLQPGEFGVYELGPDETRTIETPSGPRSFGELYAAAPDHAWANAIYLRLPEGMDDLTDAEIEVPVTDGWLGAYKDHFAIRNLTVEYFAPWANWWKFYPLYLRDFEDTWEDRTPANLLLENVTVREVNGKPLNIRGWRNVTLSHVDIIGSGDDNGGPGHVENLLVEHANFRDAGWRNRRADATPHGGGAFKLGHVTNARFHNCTFSDSFGYGVRQDGDAVYVDFVGCRVADNLKEGGIMFEIARGPIRFEDCTFIRNGQLASDSSSWEGQAGLFLLSVNHVTITGCHFEDNRPSQLVIRQHNRNPEYYEFTPETAAVDTVLHGNTFVTTYYPVLPAIGTAIRFETLRPLSGWIADEFTSDYNVYWHAFLDRPFETVSYLDLPTFQQQFDREHHSLFIQPDVYRLAAIFGLENELESEQEWVHTPLGWMFAKLHLAPWFYHEQLGWVFLHDDDDRLYLYVPADETGWLFTRADIFPWVYRFADDTWEELTW